MSTKDSIRSALLSSPKFREETIEVSGQAITVRELSIGERDRINEQSMSGEGAARKVDSARWALRMAIACARTAEGEKVFDDADIPALLEKPVGDPFQKVIDAAIKINRPPEEQGNSEAGTAGK